MSSWNFGATRGGNDPGLLDLKALLNQVTGGTLGSVGGLGTAVGSGNRSLGSGGGSSRLQGSSAYGNIGNPAGVIGALSHGLNLDGGGGSLGGGSNGGGTLYDPFSSMSTFGFFNAKDSSGGGQQGSNNHNHHQQQQQQQQQQHGGMTKSPTYQHQQQGHQQGSMNNRDSPVFGVSSHSPIHFFGGSSSSSSHHQQNNFSSNSSESNNYANKFPISTFSIDDTIPGRENRNRDNNRDSSNSYGGGSEDVSNNGHFSISHFGVASSSTNFRERDNFGSGNNSNQQSNRNSSSNNEQSGGDSSFNQGVRETGIIEKLLHSYGFIQCCERQARLFFHFSQFDGTIEHLKLGDPVEFEMTYDRRTGKPIASSVTKIGPEVVLSEERVTGTVTTELHHESNGELQGRISYENRGECFFLPYCQEDIEGNVTLSVGDTVSFQIATNQRSGNLTARYVRLENPARPVRYRGIVSSLKDNFGFIERADVAKEIFFHFSETRISDGIVVLDNVEFNIQTRNDSFQGKEVACAITKLPYGTVVFEDVGSEFLKGQILKPLDKSQCTSPALGPTPRSDMAEGRLRYRGPDRQELEVVYGEKDQQGLFTMRHGDWVQFQLAVDRRNKQQRATNVTLLEESFSVSGERREEGVISGIKGDCGYITCAERDQKMYFRFTELLDFNRQPKIADDVEFTIVQDPTSPVRQSAIRIKYLKHCSVQFEIPVSQGLHGIVTREPSTPWVSQEALAGILPSLSNLGLPTNVTERLIQSLSSAEVLAQLSGSETQGDPGVIQFTGVCANGGWPRQQDTIQFHWKDCKNLRNIRVGTKVVFDIHQVRRSRELVASNIKANTACQSADSPTNILQHFANSSSAHGGVGFNHGAMNPCDMEALMTSLLGASNNQDTIPNVADNGLVDSRIDSYSGPEKDMGTISQEYMNRTPSNSTNHNPHSSILCNNDDSDRNSNGLYRGSSSDMEEMGQGDCHIRKSSRSPSDSSSDKIVLNGSYGGYSEDSSPPQSTTKTPRVVMKGYIAALKDGFGFIETMAQDGEIFFHSSSLVGDFSALEVGQEVEYVVSSKGSASGKHAADIVKPLPKGSIGRAAVFPDILQGIVVRPLRGANPDQTEYTGLIDGQDGQAYPFGIISMLNKKELLQSGEAVEFQLDAQGKPVNIRAIRKKLRATVEAVKGQYGFLSYELEDGKKLFFHMSEVKDHQHLNPGDEVEFVILQNPRNGKSSACSVVKVGESQRPERLLNRLSKLSVDESAPRLVVVRQPFGPDGTKGFTQPRLPRKAGVLNMSRDSTGSAGSQ